VRQIRQTLELGEFRLKCIPHRRDIVGLLLIA
jgi:hypothetical protein